ncbi:peptidoglycan-binding protein [Bradyrhizobium sp. CW1]|uniref:peptidoglycan-binding protein n=1 Tax=Bradyrhizobium sp. CW1 TaxID=2782686 RepID=UPI001FFE8939|nr:peptidoglycan-binding protein [Bradyrhizobium sp. CW1]UPJ27807.1 peptidoglycan-binding protein [Bradyrhizobium sp. CW1]
MANTFDGLRAEYADLWQRMRIRPERLTEVNAIANRLIALKPRYQQVASKVLVPWHIIAVLHQREASADFAGVLHNGERIIGTGKLTSLVPKDRGPFSSWEESAVDALTMPPHSLHVVPNWTVERACFEIERYNGFGYRNHHPQVRSPYLWSFSTNYECGKYVADGHFDPDANDKQCGTMPILKMLMELDSSIRLDGALDGRVPQIGAVAGLQMGAKGDPVRQLQTALARQGFQVGDIDGDFGNNTAAAVRAFQLSTSLPPTGVADQATLQALASGPRRSPVEGFKQADVLLALVNALKARAPAPGVPIGTSSSESGTDLLHVIIGALINGQTGAAVPTTPILSPIDKALGGETLVGKKTALSVVAYVVLAILKAVGVVGVATPTGQILTILITAFGALGGTAKIDRAIQAFGIIAAKPK